MSLPVQEQMLNCQSQTREVLVPQILRWETPHLRRTPTSARGASRLLPNVRCKKPMNYSTCSARLMLNPIFFSVSTSRKGEPSPHVMYCLLWFVRVLHRSTVAVTSQVVPNASQATKAYSTHTDLLSKVFCLGVYDSRRTQVDLATTNQSLILLDMHKHNILYHMRTAFYNWL